MTFIALLEPDKIDSQAILRAAMTTRDNMDEGKVNHDDGRKSDEVFNTHIPGFTIRFAHEHDVALILDFIKRLAKYEGLSDEVVATPEVLIESLFIKRQAEVIIGELDREPVAFALFFHNFSTFLGKANLYLEDLFVDERYRGRELGRSMFACLAKITIERECERLD
ncbi:MAG: GNAT family N-acetyltransferase [Methanomassiliicoccales archaeon]|nr:GNAT family N-acetyltransferase [Methanomassiliicoccales archaeon]